MAFTLIPPATRRLIRYFDELWGQHHEDIGPLGEKEHSDLLRYGVILGSRVSGQMISFSSNASTQYGEPRLKLERWEEGAFGIYREISLHVDCTETWSNHESKPSHLDITHRAEMYPQGRVKLRVLQAGLPLPRPSLLGRLLYLLSPDRPTYHSFVRDLKKTLLTCRVIIPEAQPAVEIGES